MKQEDLGTRLKEIKEELRYMINDPGVHADTALYAYLLTAEDQVRSAVLCTDQLEEDSVWERF